MVVRVALTLVALALAVSRPCVAQICGDGTMTGGEACDDANTVGGDGCAANCTLERDLVCGLGPGAMTTIKAQFFTVPTALTGQVVLAVGGTRPDAAQDPVPFVIRSAGAYLGPAMIPGLGISCTSVGAIPGWGPGNAGGGLIDCGSTRRDGIDVAVTVDHAAPAAAPVVEHGGTGPLGSVTFELGMTTYSLLDDAPGCAMAPGTGPPSFGPDAIPCTADDPARAPARPFYGSSREATARVLNANGSAAVISSTDAGQPIDCEQLDGAGALSGATLIAVLPALNMPQLGDVTNTVRLVCAAVAAVATPTPRIVRTCVPTPTPTATPGVPATATAVPTATTVPTATAPATATSAIATASPSPTAAATAPQPTLTSAPPTVTSAPPTATPTTPAATATPTGVPPACAGDCSGDGAVTVDELVRAVNISLGSASLAQCPAVDFNGDGTVGIDELIRAVNNALQGCPR